MDLDETDFRDLVRQLGEHRQDAKWKERWVGECERIRVKGFTQLNLQGVQNSWVAVRNVAIDMQSEKYDRILSILEDDTPESLRRSLRNTTVFSLLVLLLLSLGWPVDDIKLLNVDMKDVEAKWSQLAFLLGLGFFSASTKLKLDRYTSLKKLNLEDAKKDFWDAEKIAEAEVRFNRLMKLRRLETVACHALAIGSFIWLTSTFLRTLSGP